MTLLELYNLKLHEYKTTGVRERPWKLLAMLLLSEKDKYEPLRSSQGNFYEKYKTQIDEKIAKVERDFKFTKEDIIKYIKKIVVCDNYEDQRIWFVFEDGFAVLNWGLMYREERTPEEIYSEYYDTDDLIKNYNIEEKANAYNIEITHLRYILNKILEQPKKFFTRICDELTKEELLFILSQLENKSCTNCSNQNCAIIGHINFGKSRKIQGTNCDEWINKELIGRAKVLRETDINKLR